ncbi:MAG: hypothetical protein KAS57_03910 [Gammaproteobacteria bacterium]|nr:hypothetical protein [Gammaproteobacteria bacterium]
MNKQKVATGIIIMVVGLLMINTSSIDAIIDSSSQLYMDVESHDIDLEKKTETIAFNNNDKKKISFWLVQPNRDIENKDFKIVISVLDSNKNFVKGFRRDLAFKTIRQEIDGDFYYKLGDHKFGYDFEGYIKYELEGEWLPEEKPTLSFKENRKTSFSRNQVLVSLSGAIMLALGFIVLVRNTSEQGEAEAVTKA